MENRQGASGTREIAAGGYHGPADLATRFTGASDPAAHVGRPFSRAVSLVRTIRTIRRDSPIMQLFLHGVFFPSCRSMTASVAAIVKVSRRPTPLAEFPALPSFRNLQSMAAKKSPSAKSSKSASRSSSRATRGSAKKPARGSAEGDAVVTLDRRRSGRRIEKAEDGVEETPVAVALERRTKVQRRRQIDPTTCERDYSVEEVEFMNAMDEYKRKSGRMFPTCSEVLEVIRGLGYTRLSLGERALLDTEQTLSERLDAVTETVDALVDERL
jgi:hypothetical protein